MQVTARLQDKAKVVAFRHVRAWRHTPLVINIIGILQCVRPVLHTEAIAFSGDSHRSYRYKHHRPFAPPLRGDLILVTHGKLKTELSPSSRALSHSLALARARSRDGTMRSLP